MLIELRQRVYNPELKKDLECQVDGGTYFESLDEFFTKIEKIVGNLENKKNLIVTLGNMKRGVKQQKEAWIDQELLFFDIDDISAVHKERYEEYINIIAKILFIKPSAITLIDSGNGFHILIQSKEKMDSEYFAKNKHLYQMVCAKITGELKEKGLSGELDTAVFARCRTFRCPHSINHKEGKEDKPVRLLARTTLKKAVSNIDLQKATGVSPLKDTDYMGEKEVNSFSIDTNSVLESCAFLHHAKHNPNSVNEPQWQSLISVLMTLGKGKGNGKELVHEYSKGHDRYSANETDGKIRNFELSEFSGPHNCETINQRWSRCNECPHYNKIKNPVQIKSENFIATEHHGFHNFNEKTGRYVPDEEDMVKFIKRELTYSYNENMGLRVFDGKKWRPEDRNFFRRFAATHFSPMVTKNNTMLNITKSAENIPSAYKPASFFQDTVRHLVNLENGFFNFKTREFTPHSPEETVKHGFLSVLPFEYDPAAKCPKFDAMIKKLSCNDPELEQNYMEVAGYLLSGCGMYNDKIIIFYGEGSNGKSKLAQIFRAIAGNAATSLDVEGLSSHFDRHVLQGALFNFLDELPPFSRNSFWSAMKRMSTEGTTTVGLKGKEVFKIENRCKFLMTANELPRLENADKNHGTFRRLHILPFNATFSPDDEDYNPYISEEIINEELAGVFNRVIAAYDALEKNKFKFSKSTQIEKEQTEFREENNSVLRWLKDHVEFGDSACLFDDSGKFIGVGDNQVYVQGSTTGILCNALWDHYRTWCEAEGISSGSSRGFWKQWWPALDESGIYWENIPKGASSKMQKKEGEFSVKKWRKRTPEGWQRLMSNVMLI